MNKYLIVFLVLGTVLLALASVHLDVSLFQLMLGYFFIIGIVLVATYAYLSDEGQKK